MSKAKVKKALKELDKDELIEVVMQLYDFRKESKEYLEFWANPDIIEEFEKRELQIGKVFFSGPERPRKNPEFKVLKRIFEDFQTMTYDTEHTIMLRLTALEKFHEWLTTRRKISSFEKKFEALRDATRTLIIENGMEKQFTHRFNTVSLKLSGMFECGDLPPARGYMRYISWRR